MCIHVDIILALYECEIVDSRSGCFITGKESFDVCAMVGVLVRGPFLKDGGKNASFYRWNSVSVCVASKLGTVLTVGYCESYKNGYSTY
jgi:hypothetical protein